MSRAPARCRLMHKTIGAVLHDRADAYVQDCKMK